MPRLRGEADRISNPSDHFTFLIKHGQPFLFRQPLLHHRNANLLVGDNPQADKQGCFTVEQPFNPDMLVALGQNHVEQKDKQMQRIDVLSDMRHKKEPVRLRLP